METLTYIEILSPRCFRPTTEAKINISVLREWEKQLSPDDQESSNNILLKFLEDWNEERYANRKSFRNNLCRFAKKEDETELEDLKRKLLRIAHGRERRWFCPRSFTRIMLLELIVFYHINVTADQERYTKADLDGVIPACNKDILNPYRPGDAWRLLSHSFVQNGLGHFILNLIGFVIAARFLEFRNKSWRLFLVYFYGVIWASVYVICNLKIPMVGMSAGVYALIGANIADLMWNWYDETVVLNRRSAYGPDSRDDLKSCYGWLNYFTKPRPLHRLVFRLSIIISWMIIDITVMLEEKCDDILCDGTYVARKIGAYIGFVVASSMLKKKIGFMVARSVFKKKGERVLNFVYYVLNQFLIVIFVSMFIATMNLPELEKNGIKEEYTDCNKTALIKLGSETCCLGFELNSNR